MKTNNIQEISDLNQLVIAIFLAFVVMAVVLISFFYFSRKKIVQKEFEKRDLEIAYQKDLLNSVIITQEEERKRIAQDLHDDISSQLNIVSLNSQLLKTANLSETEIREISDNIINLTKKALDNSRRIAHDLLPPVLEKFGLDAGIKELCLEISTTKAVKINYVNNTVFDFEDIDKHLHVFRILQELINNSIRHGNANNIAIAMSDNNGIKTCKYSDDGKGFNVNNAENKKGLGMKNIQSRVSFLNGTLVISSKIDVGSQFTFSF